MSKLFFKTNIIIDSFNKIIGRKPTASNLKKNGSDNSLYFGMIDDVFRTITITNFFEVENVNDLKFKKFDFVSYDKKIQVTTRINDYGQLQIRLEKNGTMYKLLNLYLKEINAKDYDLKKLFIILDFKSFIIYFQEIV